MLTSSISPSAEADPSQARWHVAHTKPRCEKKFAALLTAECFAHELPLVKVQRRYGVRVRIHSKALFPGYVFTHVVPELRARCFQQNLLVRLIEVADEPKFLIQLEAVRRILASGFETAVRPLFAKGRLVQVVSGPLRGLQGVVDDPNRPGGVIIMVDALQQGLLVKIPAVDLRLA